MTIVAMDAIEHEREAVASIVRDWSVGGAANESRVWATRFADFLAPPVGVIPQGRSALLNMQLSVDTRRPDQLRIVVNPFAGRVLGMVSRPQLQQVLGILGSSILTQRVLRLYQLGYAMPDVFSVGMASSVHGTVCKAYVASHQPLLRPWLPQLARDAGWLPPVMPKGFSDLYEKIAGFGILEGVGISAIGDRWLGTTCYVRSQLPWAAFAAADLAHFLQFAPAACLGALTELFTEEPKAVGWSLESDANGRFVDAKVEVASEALRDLQTLLDYADAFGVDPLPIQRLAEALRTAGLSGGRGPAPQVTSLRFVDGQLQSIVAYFPLFTG